jgi:E3 ubiquitin-protein ligase DOA10
LALDDVADSIQREADGKKSMDEDDDANAAGSRPVDEDDDANAAGSRPGLVQMRPTGGWGSGFVRL